MSVWNSQIYNIVVIAISIILTADRWPLITDHWSIRQLGMSVNIMPLNLHTNLPHPLNLDNYYYTSTPAPAPQFTPSPKSRSPLLPFTPPNSPLLPNLGHHYCPSPPQFTPPHPQSFTPNTLFCLRVISTSSTYILKYFTTSKVH